MLLLNCWKGRQKKALNLREFLDYASLPDGKKRATRDLLLIRHWFYGWAAQDCLPEWKL